MKNIISEELESMKYLFGYKRGKVISEQAPAVAANTTPPPANIVGTPPPASVEDVIKQIQTVLKTKFGANLGTSGPNKDGIDGKWGNLTQTAIEQAIAKVKGGGVPAAPAAPVTPAAPAAPVTPAAPAAPVTPATPATPVTPATPATPVTPATPATPAEPQLSQVSQDALAGKLTPQQIRQQSRFDQRLARQARRNERRAGQQ